MEHKKNLVLCGFKKSGKTTLGALIGVREGYAVSHIDQEIEGYYFLSNNESLSVAEIYQKKGSSYFRLLEKKVISLLCIHQPACIIPGAGAWKDEDNCSILKELGDVIYIKSAFSDLYQRIMQDSQNNFLKSFSCEEMNRLYIERCQCYEAVADVTIDITGLSTEKSYQSIKEELYIYGC